MATFKVIKEHDGVKVGELRELPPSALTAFMVENGYWAEVKDKVERPVIETKTTSKANTKKSK